VQQLLKTMYYNQLAKIKENIPFFDRLNTYLQKHWNIIPDYHPLICAIERLAKLCHNLVTKQSTVSIRPPLNTISIPVSKDDSVTATPFKPAREIEKTKKLTFFF